MRNYNIAFATKSIFRELYDESALTWVGMSIEDDNLEAVVGWLDDVGAKPVLPITFYVTRGELMNDICGLTGSNAYPDDLHILSVKLDDLENAQKVILPRFEVGGSWFDDIVDNNVVRERGE